MRLDLREAEIDNRSACTFNCLTRCLYDRIATYPLSESVITTAIVKRSEIWDQRHSPKHNTCCAAVQRDLGQPESTWGTVTEGFGLVSPVQPRSMACHCQSSKPERTCSVSRVNKMHDSSSTCSRKARRHSLCSVPGS